MITQSQFNRAMQEINESFANASGRIQALEDEVAELKKPKPKTKTTKSEEKQEK